MIERVYEVGCACGCWRAEAFDRKGVKLAALTAEAEKGCDTIVSVTFDGRPVAWVLNQGSGPMFARNQGYQFL
jgi:hypothetical protein